MFFTRDKSFYKNLFRLALPIALQNLVTFAVGLADNLMIGTLGDTAVSGVYMGGQIQTLLQIFSVGIEGTVLILSAQYWGKRDTESIKHVVSTGIKTSVAAGLLLSAVCLFFPRFVVSLFTNEAAVIESGAVYLKTVALSYGFFCLTQALIAATRAVESANVGLLVSLVSLAVNVGLNYVFIFGKLGAPALGVRGAAIATVIARGVECAAVIFYVLVKDEKLKYRPKDLLRTDAKLRRDFFRYGAPIVAGQMVWAANMLLSSAILGRFTEEVVAAVSITATMNNLAYVVMNGMAGAVGIITGKTVGRGDTGKIREYAKTVQVIFLLLGFVTGAAVYFLRLPYLSLWNVSDTAVAEAKSLLQVLSVTVVGTCYQCACLFGLVKSGGDVGFVFRNDLVFVFLVVLPAGFLLQRLGGAPAWVFLALKSDQILKCFVAVWKINKYDWMKNLTRGQTPPTKE